MRYLIAGAAILTISAGAMAQGRYTYVYNSFSECRTAAKEAAKAGVTVTDCHRVDGGWTYEASPCQDGQCTPD
jgi:hypothetical protein